MGKLVTPKVHLIGYTCIDYEGLTNYLNETNNQDFLASVNQAKEQGLSDGEILCSFYAKLCYASLTLGKNENITRTRDIPNNIKGCFNQGHSSVFRHTKINFVIHNGSRVLECEMLRHCAGTDYTPEEEGSGIDYSILSGRYVRENEINIVFDPILKPIQERIEWLQESIEIWYQHAVEKMELDKIKDQVLKKKITSALRRIMPEGKAKEIGFTINLQALRHIVQLRTSHHAEWEIREVFNQVYQLTKDKFPLLYYGAKEEIVDGLLEVSGMKMQPY